MITRAASRKVQHIQHNPSVSIFWADGDGAPQRSVMVQARITMTDDSNAIDAFGVDYRRKNPARTRPLPTGSDSLARVILLAEPTLVRADGFAGYRPIVLRGDDLDIPQETAP